MNVGDSVRIYHLHPLLAGELANWDGHLARAAAMRFSHVLVAPPFMPGRSGSVFVTADYDRLHPAVGRQDATEALRSLVEKARGHGLQIMLDLVIDRVAAGSDLARVLGASQDEADEPPDPRLGEQHVASLHFDDSNHNALGWWQARLATWVGVGIAGFRCCEAARVPAFVWSSLIPATRAIRPETLFVAWDIGAGARGLDDCDFDFAASASWAWDMRADWLDTDTSDVAEVGDLLAMPEMPFGDRLAATPVNPMIVCERALRFATVFGSAWLMPMGFEFMSRRKLDPIYATARSFESLAASPPYDLSPVVTEVNAAHSWSRGVIPATVVSSPGGRAVALLEPEPAQRLVLVNASPEFPATLDLELLGPRLAGLSIDAADRSELAPGEVRTLLLHRHEPVVVAMPGEAVEHATLAPRLAIEGVTPSVDGGRFPVKRVVGETITVGADIICDGHDKLDAVLLWRPADTRAWNEVPMRQGTNDRWTASFVTNRVGRYEFTIEAWKDVLGGFREDLAKKRAAGLDVTLELQEEALLVPDAHTRNFAVCHMPVQAVDAERASAAFASWYELFPRSMSGDADRHGNFDDVIAHLPYVRDMGFDVLYFPPIHPIGRKNRKGPNNTLEPGPTDPGSPYAVGADEGGHDAIHRELGTLADFRRLLAAAAEHGLEIALDFAIQCAPDHPWLREHPEWFEWRPDGTVKYAENPPKKYQDIVNVSFYAEGAKPSLWLALRDIVEFWVREGIRLFRVDNPHTKPLPFWEWMIADVKSRHPDVVFLAEAFTRPKLMYRLAKVGFSQSYTYFTWRNTAWELREYLTELSTTAPKDFFRPHFFVNTPDINPIFLHDAGRPGFLLRAALAATLSGLWGVYCGFELCEARALNGREEYLDSEKYQMRQWDFAAPGNIIAEIRMLNHIRRTNPALHSHLGVQFLPCSNDQMLCFVKSTPARDNQVVVAICLDPRAPQEGDFDVSLRALGLTADTELRCDDLVAGTTSFWRTGWRRLRLDPAVMPFALWRVRPTAEG